MTRTARFIARWAAVLPLLLVAAAAPWVAAALMSVGSDLTDMRQWLPDRRREREQYDEFVKAFGADDVVIVSWPGCTLSDPRLPRLARALTEQAEYSGLFRRAATGASLLERLTSGPSPMSRERAVARLQGVAIGPDGSTSCAVVEFTARGKRRPHDVVRAIYDAARRHCGLSADQLRVGGGLYEAVIIDRYTSRSLREGVGLSCLISLAAAWVCLRSVALTFTVLATGGFCSALSIALVHYTGASLNAVMIVMPTLVLVLVVSGAVHLVNYHRDVVGRSPRDSARRAMAAGWTPCTLASLTTALGMMSLGISQIRPIRYFGLYSAAGLLASLLVMLALLYSAFTFLGRRAASRRGRSSEPPVTERRVDRLVRRYAGLLLAHHRLAGALCLALFAVVGLGLLRTRTSVQIERMFRSDNELIRNYEWLEQNVAPLSALEVVLKVPSSAELDMVDQLELVRRVAAGLHQLPLSGGVFSAATFWPVVGDQQGMLGTMRRVALNRRLDRHREQLVGDGLLAPRADGSWWRVTVRLPALKELDFSQVIGEVRRRVADATGELPVEATFTGAFPVIQSAQKQLLRDLVNSFLLAFALICPVIVVILRGLLPGLAAMAVNVAPAVAIFGGMGWLQAAVDIGAVLTASVALGIAVDDTLHLLTWFNRGLRQGMERPVAVSFAICKCAPAMVQTTMICGLGILAFANSSFVPASQFAWLMVALLISALIGDLVLLPAMLVGAVGRTFGSTRHE